jgi:hypothetical protein
MVCIKWTKEILTKKQLLDAISAPKMRAGNFVRKSVDKRLTMKREMQTKRRRGGAKKWTWGDGDGEMEMYKRR